MSLHTINVVVSGMGGIINFEALLIERMFKELGYEIEVDNDSPFDERRSHLFNPDSQPETEDEYIERVKKLKHNQTKIAIKVKHHPWGG